ncbi:glycosyltransferase [Sphingomonas sp. IC4-52]|uniref:glycosyltransferase n=1 Tax=Sphingomonas sp. IC4-52 TaxID=2887202 RepID=UPI001D122D9E|nr:glycosyltransferase [Sphingomonas sp. IC4-52]MCC2980798.1 glycosyltransferase [Sphingomonas sp. IC4-52]
MISRYTLDRIDKKKNAGVISKKPSVLVLAKYYHPYNGGIENATRIFCEGMVQTNDVQVISFNSEPGFSSECVYGVGVRRYPVHFTAKSQPISIGYFLAVLCSRADVIHFHAPNVVASLALALRPAKKTIVVHHMDIYGRPKLRRLARNLYDKVLKRATLLIVTSLKNAHVSADLRVKVPTRAVPLGIEPSDYTVDEVLLAEAGAWRRELAGDQPLIGFVGRHARYKGIDILLQAIARLPGVHLAIGGKGPYQAEMRALAIELMIADRVHFIGEISHRDKLKLLSAIDVFAFPSTEITEAFGISQLEAMLLGAAVVASELPTGVSDVSRNNETALTVPPGDAEALAAAIGRLLADDALRQRLVQKAREGVLREFTTAVMTRQYNALNDAVIAGTLT